MRGSTGVSPLVASLGLILATIVISAFIANYVTSAYNAEYQKSMICQNSTTINYVTYDYPRFYDSRIEATVQVNGSSLSGFAFDITLVNGTAVTYPNMETDLLVDGSIGTLKTGVLPFNAPDISSVVITTNCTNVATVPRSLR
jgi:archaellum component FlaF (FlaF/FlaG flagellin family)